MSQEIKDIDIKYLVLWTENPRDPVDVNLSDQDIADRAISNDGRSRWSLKKLFEKMGPRFDQSEIPTVAYVDNKPVVYDGNRRVLIGKIINGFVSINGQLDFSEFDFPRIIPCNVCDIRTALDHVDRKHADSGSWKTLEREVFKHKHMGEKKSPFLIIEEKTGLISDNPEMNQGFVRDEIFDPKTLHEIGFSTNGNKLQSKYKREGDAEAVLNKIVHLVKTKEITTRKNRGETSRLIGTELLGKQGASFKEYNPKSRPPENQRKTPISKGMKHPLFGEKLLVLKAGTVNNLYSDCLKLYKDKDKYSDDFSMIIRMSLRLITETAAQDSRKRWMSMLKKIGRRQKNNFLKMKKQRLIFNQLEVDSL